MKISCGEKAIKNKQICRRDELNRIKNKKVTAFQKNTFFGIGQGT